jgi:HTH-type transcriptional regulator, competence development regulator
MCSRHINMVSLPIRTVNNILKVPLPSGSVFCIINLKGCIIVNFGEYLKHLRNEKQLSQRELAEKTGISNAEISRLETGDRKNPSPATLKAIAPHLGVSYHELMKNAGYIEEVIDHQGFTENIYRDENGRLIDIIRNAKDMYEKDSEWANIAFRVTSADLSQTELNAIKAATEAMLDQFLKSKK